MSEIGSGLSDSRAKYLSLIAKVVEGSVGTIVCHNKDRLSRFGTKAFQFLCDKMGVNLIFIDNLNSEKSYEEEMVEDLMSIVHVYSCRAYGRRAGQVRAVPAQHLFVMGDQAEQSA